MPVQQTEGAESDALMEVSEMRQRNACVGSEHARSEGCITQQLKSQLQTAWSDKGAPTYEVDFVLFASLDHLQAQAV